MFKDRNDAAMQLAKKLNKYKKIPFLTIINISHTSANNLSENKEIHAFCPIFLM